MTDSNTVSNPNGNQQAVDQSTNDNDAGSMATGQTNPNCVPMPVQETTSIQTDTAAYVRENHQMRNQSIRRALPMDDPHRFEFGDAQPDSSNSMISGLNQGAQGINRITQPMDEMNINGILSTSVTVHHPYPRESVAVQDAQPHSMPVPVIFNRIPHELATNAENNRPRVDGRASTNVMQDSSSLELIGQVIIRESTMTIAPTEHPHDTEFSVDTLESHSGNQLNAGNEVDAHHHVYDNTSPSSNENNLPPTNEGQKITNSGVAIINNETVTSSNQTNIAANPPNATRMPQSLCPQASDDERNVQNPMIGVNQTRTPITPSLNLLIPKVPSPLDSGDDSSEENAS